MHSYTKIIIVLNNSLLRVTKRFSKESTFKAPNSLIELRLLRLFFIAYFAQQVRLFQKVTSPSEVLTPRKYWSIEEL